jgi:hypothetical protein
MDRFKNFLKRATATEVIPEMVLMNPQDLAFLGFKEDKGVIMNKMANSGESMKWEPRSP